MTPLTTSFSINDITPTLISDSDSGRQYMAIYVETGSVYVKLGLNVSSSDYSYKFTRGALFEFPVQHDASITAISTTGIAILRVTTIG